MVLKTEEERKSLTEIAAAIKSPSPTTIIPLGLKGTMRNLAYIKAHRGKSHPYALLFGPLGGLLIPEDQLQPEVLESTDKPERFLPTSPTDGPPLPKTLGIKWPWKK